MTTNSILNKVPQGDLNFTRPLLSTVHSFFDQV